jgi:probable biosynthetic protein (TIGR04098 family)
LTGHRFELELGMPHLGRNNLSESTLFKEIGHHRWKTIEALAHAPSAEWRDSHGARIYATFYFVEIDCPPARPLSHYGENQVLRFDSDLAHFGRTQLDGHYHLDGGQDMRLRACNVFVVQEDGPSRLRITPPQNLDYSQIRALATQPDARHMCRHAREIGSFFGPEEDDVPLFDGRRAFRYQLDADRDLNGAGLVYFANFIAFLDLAERRILGDGPDGLPEEVLDQRSTYRRMIGYYGNARSTDSLAIEISARARVIAGEPRQLLLDLGIDYTVTRESDGRLIVVSSARKVAPLLADSAAAQATTAILRGRKSLSP